MSEANLELVRAFFASAPNDLAAAVADSGWVERTRVALAPLLTEDFEFVTVESVGRPATRPGVEGFFAAYTEYMTMWESASLLPNRFVEVGDKVVVEATLSGITRTGGVRLEQAVAAVYTLADGRIRRIEEFSDPADAYAAASG